MFEEDDITDFFVNNIATTFKTDMTYCCYGTRRIEARDGTIILPFMKCWENQAKGSIFVKEGMFCDQESDRNGAYVIRDLDTLSPTVLSQAFLKSYDDFVKEKEQNKLDTLKKEATEQMNAQFYEALVKDNQLNEYLANPLRFHKHNPKRYFIQNAIFVCDNYIEGAINKYVNVTHPHMIPLFTYYASTDMQRSQLEKEFKIRYECYGGAVPNVVEEKDEREDIDTRKDKIVAENLRIGYGVLLIPGTSDKYQEMSEGTLYFVKERYFDNYIIVSAETGEDYVIDCQDAVYADIIDSESSWKEKALQAFGINVT